MPVEPSERTVLCSKRVGATSFTPRATVVLAARQKSERCVLYPVGVPGIAFCMALQLPMNRLLMADEVAPIFNCCPMLEWAVESCICTAEPFPSTCSKSNPSCVLYAASLLVMEIVHAGLDCTVAVPMPSP